MLNIANFQGNSIKTTRYYITPIRMAIIKKVITSVTEDGEIGTYIHSWWVCKDTEWLLWKTIWQFLKRLIKELPY